MTQDDEFPFNNPYYDLIKGQTLSKRGVWWTALLLVKQKKKETDEAESAVSETTDKTPIKVIIQRWRRYKQEDGGHRWSRSKDFTISSKKQYLEIKKTLDKWIEEGIWT